MKRCIALALLLGATMATGCARPFEIGYTPAYSTGERAQIIARNWDWEGKQIQDDVDTILVLRPAGHLSIWDLR